MDLQKEREAFEAWASEDVENFIDAIFDGKYYVMRENSRLNQKDKEFLILSLNRGWKAWQASEAQVKEVAQRQGGYYIRDLRNQPGNCMKFWYKAGYGTKHKNFFWCATLEEAKEYKGGCDWFEIWHAPYIDSLVEHTVDFQLADRGIGLVDLKAREQAHD